MGFNLDDYEPVEVRLDKFWKEHQDGRIETELLEASKDRFIVCACAGSKAIIWLTNRDSPISVHLASHPLRGSPFRLEGECDLERII